MLVNKFKSIIFKKEIETLKAKEQKEYDNKLYTIDKNINKETNTNEKEKLIKNKNDFEKLMAKNNKDGKMEWHMLKRFSEK